MYASAYNNRGVVKRKTEDYDGAIADFTKAIKCDPNNFHARNNLRAVKARSKDYDEEDDSNK